MKNIYLILLILLAYSYTYAQECEKSIKNYISLGATYLILPNEIYGRYYYGGEISYLNNLGKRNCLGLNLSYLPRPDPYLEKSFFIIGSEYRRYLGAKTFEGFYVAFNLELEIIDRQSLKRGNVIIQGQSSENICTGFGLGFNTSLSKNFSGFLKSKLGYIVDDSSFRINFGGGIAYLF
jgi:hypothetical protein